MVFIAGNLCYNIFIYLFAAARRRARLNQIFIKQEEQTLICPKCGTNNPDYFVYCKKCSAELPAAPLPSESAPAQPKTPHYDDPETYRTAQRRAAPAQPAESDLKQEGPYYDPRQRHHALDPWELLRDDPEEKEAAPEPEQPAARPRSPYEENAARREQLSQERFSRQPAVTTSYKPRQHYTDEYTPRTEQFTQPRQERRVTPAPAQRREDPSQPARTTLSAREEEQAFRPRTTRTPLAQPQQEPSRPARTQRLEEPVQSARREFSASAPRRMEPPQGENEFSRSRSREDRFSSQSAAPASRRPAFSDRESGDQTRKFTRPAVSALSETEDAPLSSRELRAQQRLARQEEKEQARQQAVSARRAAKAPASQDEFSDDEQSLHRSKVINIAFWVVIGLLAIATLFFTYRFLSERYGSIGGAFSAWFGGGSPAASAEQPVVEETVYDGMTAHSITVYGPDGDTAVFYDPTTGAELKRAVLQNGGYKLTIVDLNWIPDEPGDAETMEIKPRVTLIDSENNETELDVPAFTIAVPQAALTVTSPDVSAPVTPAGETLAITGSVEAGSATRLLWGEEDITSCIDSATGAFTYEAALDGSAQYTLTAVYARHRNAVVTIDIAQGQQGEGTETSAPSAGSLEVTVGTLPSSTENDTQMISGTVPAGSTVTVDGPVSGEITTTEGGSFSFVADLSSGYGIHTYTINATFGTESGSATCSILRTPEIDAYSRKAQIFEYATVLKNPNDSKGKIYRLDGTVQSVEQIESGHQQVLFYVGDDSSQPVLLDYFSNSTLKVGSTYRVFADANGNTEETDSQPKMPRMNAWFAGRS